MSLILDKFLFRWVPLALLHSHFSFLVFMTDFCINNNLKFVARNLTLLALNKTNVALFSL